MSGGWILLGLMVLGVIGSMIRWYPRVQRSDFGSVSRRWLVEHHFWLTGD